MMNFDDMEILLRFLQLLCEGHNEIMQEVCGGGPHSVWGCTRHYGTSDVTCQGMQGQCSAVQMRQCPRPLSARP